MLTGRSATQQLLHATGTSLQKPIKKDRLDYGVYIAEGKALGFRVTTSKDGWFGEWNARVL